MNSTAYCTFLHRFFFCV